jgi:hypothetical protein
MTNCYKLILVLLFSPLIGSSQNIYQLDSFIVKKKCKIEPEILQNRLVLFTSDIACKPCFNQLRFLFIDYRKVTKKRTLVILKCIPNYMYQKEVIHKYGLDDSLLFEVFFDNNYINLKDDAFLQKNTAIDDINLAMINENVVYEINEIFDKNKLRKGKKKLLLKLKKKLYKF